MMALKYNVIVKSSSEKYLKYKVTDLLLFTEFLDKKFNGWLYFNVYDYKTREHLGSFQQTNRPKKRKI